MAVLFVCVTSCLVLMIKGVYKMDWGRLVFERINHLFCKDFHYEALGTKENMIQRVILQETQWLKFKVYVCHYSINIVIIYCT